MTANLVDLLQDTPANDELTLTEETHLHTPYTRQHGVRINRNGKKLWLTQPLTFAPLNPAETMKLLGPGPIQWTKANAGNERALIMKGGFEIEDAQVLLDVSRSGSNLSFSAPAWLIEIDAPDACAPARIDGVSASGNFQYGAGFLNGKQCAGLEALEVAGGPLRYIHGGIILVGARHTRIKHVATQHVSWTSFFANLFEDLEFFYTSASISGDGTSGDGMMIGSGNGLRVIGHRNKFGSCYGGLVKPDANIPLVNALFENCDFSAGLTAGFFGQGYSASQRIEGLTITGCQFAYNGGRAVQLRNVNGLRVMFNEFCHNNNSNLDDGSQIAFVDANNMPTSNALANVHVAEWHHNSRVKQYGTEFSPPVEDYKLPYVPI